MHYPRLKDNVGSHCEFNRFLELYLASTTSGLLCLIIGVHALLDCFSMLVTSYELCSVT